MSEIELLNKLIEIEEEANREDISKNELILLKKRIYKIKHTSIDEGFNELIFRSEDDLNEINILIR